MDARELIDKYNAGNLSEKERLQLEGLLERGEVALKELNDVHHLAEVIKKIGVPEPSATMTTGFYDQLALHKQKKMASADFIGKLAGLWSGQGYLKWAYSAALVIFGLAVGLWVRPMMGSNDKLETLADEVSQMKEMMMLTLIQKESISDRLKAVNLTGEMDNASDKVTSALLNTLKSDENVNVRLASIEALYPYTGDARVREGLIKSISSQHSPLVQIALAEMMVILHEKRSVTALESIAKNKNTPPEIKEKMEESIDILI